MSYLELLKKFRNAHVPNLQNHQNHENGGSVGFDGATPGAFEKFHGEPGEGHFSQGAPQTQDRLALPDAFEIRITALLRYQVIDERQASALRTLWRNHHDAAETKLFRVEVESYATPCDRCRHARKPGAAVYCSARDDLEPAYGINHPLRRVPVDRGHSCNDFLGVR